MKDQHFTEKDQQTLANIMQARRDIRGNKFLPTPVPQKELDKILQAASWAPSVGFSQPWEFVMVNDKRIRKNIVANFNTVNNQAKMEFENEKQQQYQQLKLEGILEAPVNIAVFYRPSNKPVLGQYSMEETGMYSVVCAIQNMWLMARAMNIGLGWVSILDPNTIERHLNAPKGSRFVAYLCLGYTNEFLQKPELEILKWEERKQIRNAVFENSY